MSFGGVLKGFPDLMSFVMFCCKLFTILRIENFLVFYEKKFLLWKKMEISSEHQFLLYLDIKQ